MNIVLKIARPRFWSYTIGPFLIGTALATSNLSVFFSCDFWLFFGYFLLPANWLIYGINDVFDIATDQLNPKKQAQETYAQDQIKKVYMSVIFIALLTSIWLFIYASASVKFSLLVFWFLSFFYSAPPLRFKARPILDSLSNILYLIPGIIGFQLTNGGALSWVFLLTAASWTTAMHLFSAIPDIEADQIAGIATSATWFGQRISLLVCALLWLYTVIMASSWQPFLIILAIYPVLPILVFTGKQSIEKVYWWFPFLNIGIGAIIFWWIMLVV